MGNRQSQSINNRSLGDLYNSIIMEEQMIIKSNYEKIKDKLIKPDHNDFDNFCNYYTDFFSDYNDALTLIEEEDYMTFWYIWFNATIYELYKIKYDIVNDKLLYMRNKYKDNLCKQTNMVDYGRTKFGTGIYKSIKRNLYKKLNIKIYEFSRTEPGLLNEWVNFDNMTIYNNHNIKK